MSCFIQNPQAWLYYLKGQVRSYNQHQTKQAELAYDPTHACHAWGND